MREDDARQPGKRRRAARNLDGFLESTPARTIFVRLEQHVLAMLVDPHDERTAVRVECDGGIVNLLIVRLVLPPRAPHAAAASDFDGRTPRDGALCVCRPARERCPACTDAQCQDAYCDTLLYGRGRHEVARQASGYSEPAPLPVLGERIRVRGRSSYTVATSLGRPADAFHMPVIGAATAADHAQCRHPLAQSAILHPERLRIAGVQFRHGVELGVAAHRRVRSDPRRRPPQPWHFSRACAN